MTDESFEDSRRRSGAGETAASPRTNVPPIVDAHHHLWNLRALHYPWLDDAVVEDFMFGDYAGLRQNYEAPQYLADAAGLGVVATVHCEAEADRADPVAETRWLTAQHAAHGFPNAIVAWADFADPAFERTLDQHLASPLTRGVRCKPRLTGERTSEDFESPAWLAGLERTQGRGLTWDLRVPWTHLEAAAPVAARHDATPIVLNHCGLPWDRRPEAMEVWRRGMRALAALPHVRVKLSELGLRDEAWSLARNLPVLTEVLDLFGPARCLFASNFPVAGLRIGYAGWVRAIEVAVQDCGADERAAVFGRNAADVYRIDLPAAAPSGRPDHDNTPGSQPGASAQHAATQGENDVSRHRARRSGTD